MKFLHTSDWHLGRDFRNYDLTSYQDDFLSQILAQIETYRPDALLISGDVLDKSNPGDADLDKLSDFLNQARHITRIVLIAGNHDGASRLGFAKGFTLPEVSIVTRAAQVGTAIEIPGTDGGLGALIYPIPYLYPYHDRAELSSWVDTDGTRHLDDALEAAVSKDTPAPVLPGKPEALFAAALRRIGRDLERRNTDVPVIAMAHDYLTQVDPDKDVEPLGNLCPIPVSLLDNLAGSLSEGRGLDYLALGHIHGAFPVQGTKVAAWYAGSPLPYRVSENNKKCTLLVEVNPNHQVKIQQLALNLPYQVARLQGSIEELTNPDDSRYQPWHQAFCSITLTETTLPPNAYNQLKAVFPRMLKLSHLQSTQTQTPQSEVEVQGFSELEIAAEFLGACGIDTEDDLALLNELYESTVRGRGNEIS